MNNLMRPEHAVYTQRNNARYPDETCWPTSVIQALHIRDIKMPDGKYPQPEDNLADFCEKDSNIRKMHAKADPERSYKPWQVHDVLCEAVNRWLGFSVAKRAVNNKGINFRQYIDSGRCVVISGRFPYYSGRPISHAICVHGYDDDGLFICDPWGDYKELYASGVKCVRNIHMPWDDAKEYLGTSAIII